ncbi:MAG: hypothetical protein V2A62_00545 [Candidatus Woesearchaeota archaeon]
MNTPLRSFELAMRELIGPSQPIVYFGYAPPEEKELRVICVPEMLFKIPSDSSVSSYVLARFSKPDLKAVASFSFAQKEGEWVYSQRGSDQPAIEILRDWYRSQLSDKQMFPEEVGDLLAPTPEKAYLHLPAGAKDGDFFKYDIYSTRCNDLIGHLRLLELDGGVRYNLWTPSVSYSLEMNGDEPLSRFNVHQLEGDVASMRNGLEAISHVVEVVNHINEKSLIHFMRKANERK